VKEKRQKENIINSNTIIIDRARDSFITKGMSPGSTFFEIIFFLETCPYIYKESHSRDMWIDSIKNKTNRGSMFIICLSRASSVKKPANKTYHKLKS